MGSRRDRLALTARLLLPGAVALIIGACGSGESGPEGSPSGAASADTADSIEKGRARWTLPDAPVATGPGTGGTSGGSSTGAGGSGSSGGNSSGGSSAGGGSPGGGTTPEPAKPVAVAPLTDVQAVRFLQQASFGPNEAAVARVRADGLVKSLQAQFDAAVSRYKYTLPEHLNKDQIHVYLGDFCGQFAVGTPQRDNCWRDWYTSMPIQWDFFSQAVSGADQLRQKVAWALGQIFVTSGVELSAAYGFAEYHQMLRNQAFGNLRSLLEQVALSPFMGDYLDMVDNDGRNPNENFARELLQLFSLGTCLLNPDGSLQSGKCIATYDNAVVREYAYALSGWTFPAGGKLSWCNPTCGGWKNPRYYRGSMVAVEARHDKTQRVLLGGTVAPAGRTARQGLNAVLDSLMAHQNLAPFMSRQLIQHLVTSNPSPAYVGRVAQAFTAGRFSAQGVVFGTGVRGDLKATLAAILLDSEARDAGSAAASTFGKLREPVVMMAAAIRALDGTTDGDRLGLWGWGAGMSQTPFNSPSVFNFYPPDFPLTGTPLVGPQFAIMTTNTTFARINFANDLVYWWYGKGEGLAPNPTIPGATGTRVSYARWEPLLIDAATDSIKVVDRLSLLLTAGALGAADKQAIVTAMAEYGPRDTWLTDASNRSSWQRERVKTAAYLILASPQYQIQR